MQGTWLEVELVNSVIVDAEVIACEYAGKLGEPELLKLQVLSKQSPKELSAALGTSVVVKILGTDQNWDFNLRLFQLEQSVATELMNRNVYTLELRSPVAALNHGLVTPVLKGVSLAQACQLLLSGRFGSNRVGEPLQPYRFEIDALDVHSPVPMLQGLNESLYSFFNRMLAFYGLSYYFDHTNAGMMVISDNVGQFAASVSIIQNRYAEGELLTVPHYEQAFKTVGINPGKVITAGHPRNQPESLVEGIGGTKQSQSIYQTDFREFAVSEADRHAKLLFLANQGAANRNNYIGGGILFPGMVDSEQQELLIETNFTRILHAAAEIKW